MSEQLTKDQVHNTVCPVCSTVHDLPMCPPRAACDGGTCGLGGYCDECQSAKLTAEKVVKSPEDFAVQLKETLRCNCDLDNWEPEKTTGHSCVCRIHRHAWGHYNAQFNGGCVEIKGVRGYD